MRGTCWWGGGRRKYSPLPPSPLHLSPSLPPTPYINTLPPTPSPAGSSTFVFLLSLRAGGVGLNLQVHALCAF